MLCFWGYPAATFRPSAAAPWGDMSLLQPLRSSAGFLTSPRPHSNQRNRPQPPNVALPIKFKPISQPFSRIRMKTIAVSQTDRVAPASQHARFLSARKDAPGTTVRQFSGKRTVQGFQKMPLPGLFQSRRKPRVAVACDTHSVAVWPQTCSHAANSLGLIW